MFSSTDKVPDHLSVKKTSKNPEKQQTYQRNILPILLSSESEFFLHQGGVLTMLSIKHTFTSCSLFSELRFVDSGDFATFLFSSPRSCL